MTRRLISIAVLAWSPAVLAAGPDKKACAASFEKAQQLHHDNKYSSARAELVTCTDASCPGWIKDECKKINDDIDRNQPSIVIIARDASGKDVGDATVTIDGEARPEKTNGVAIRVDPGEHTVRIARPDSSGKEQAAEEKFIARAGDKNREVKLAFAPDTVVTQPTVEPTTKRASPLPSILVASAGLVALGVGIGIGASAMSDVSSMRTSCAPRCAQGDVDSANTRLVISDVLIPVGIAGVAAGAVLFLIRPKVSEQTGLVVMPTMHGASASFSMRF